MSVTPAQPPQPAAVAVPTPSRQPSRRPAPPATPAILGMGAFVPDGRVTNADLERLVDTSDSWILERTGIRERRRGAPGETASMQGARAAAIALERAGNPEIDGIIVCTASPDTLFPSVAALIQRKLGLGTVPAFDLSAACTGFVYGLTVADALIRAGRNQTLLVVAAESMTSLIDWKDRSTCILFGDGAGAAVVGSAPRGGIQAAAWGCDGRHADLIFYGPAVDAEGGVTGDPAIRMMGKGTFRFAVERMAETAEQLCADAGWSVEEVDHVVPHQANLRIIDAVAKRLHLRPEQVIVNGDRFGNTSAASIPLALDEAWTQGRMKAGDKVIAVAFGSGVTWGGVALEWSMDAPSGAEAPGT